MIHLVTQHGTGDTYMTLAFATAVGRCRGTTRVVVHIRPEHAAIAAMFPDVQSQDDAAWASQKVISDIAFFHCHPTNRSGGLDISRFALLDRPTTHADLWRAMLDLPLEEPMTRGQVVFGHKLLSGNHVSIANRVVLITQARSWPNHHPQFWEDLRLRLMGEGWDVRMNNDHWLLADLFQECADAEWVIGPQCGVMAILCHAQFPCRKTIATPAVEGTNWIVPRTFPYAYVTKFAGEDYGDVEEVLIPSESRLAVDNIMAGVHAHRVPVTNRQVFAVEVPMTPGDLMDRLSVLMLKTDRLPPLQAATFRKESMKFWMIASAAGILKNVKALDAFTDLHLVNGAAWDHNNKAVPDALAHREMQASHAEAIRMNRERVRLKNQISDICGSPSQEIKSYYEGGKA